MENKPLLLFENKETATWENPKRNIPGKHHYPSHDAQSRRLSSKFQALQGVVDGGRLALQSTPAGIDPEYTLVFEVGNDVQAFYTAIKHLNDGTQASKNKSCYTTGGFAEIVFDYSDFSDAEDEFYQVDNKGNRQEKVECKFYCVSTNLTAMNQILSLWGNYKQDANYKFPNGQTGFRDVFKQLKDVRRWGIKDRLEDTGILDDWRAMLAGAFAATICEIELKYTANPAKQHTREGEITALIVSIGGKVVDRSLIDEIRYHALLVELPRKFVEDVLENANVNLVLAESIMFFKSTGQSVVTNGQNINANITINPPENIIDEPVIALLDGMPQANYPYLRNLLIIDDVDYCEDQYNTVDKMRHGTSMASLIAYGDLNRIEHITTRKIYVRPVLKPDTSGNESATDILLVDKIYVAVRRLFENINEDNPIAPNVKVINFSIGAYARLFDKMISPLARLLDWLSYKYNVLFVVSAGNHGFHNDILELDEAFSVFASKSLAERNNTVINAVYKDSRNRRLRAPAESINALTVGASFSDFSTFVETGQLIAPCNNGMGHILSAVGAGLRRSIKPDIIYHGGRFLLREHVINSDQANMLLSSPTHAPGILSAAPFQTGTDRELYTHGTSSATALITHEAARCYDVLSSLVEDGYDIPTEYFAVLIKAMLTHGAEWGELSSIYTRALGKSGRGAADLIHRFIGYGLPNTEKAISCTERRVTLIGVGSLKNGEAEVYTLPLPFDFSKKTHKKLTITLASFAPIVPTNQRYKATRIWFDIQDSLLKWDRTEVSDEAAVRGTLQHEIFVNNQARAWDDSDGGIKLKVNCSFDADKTTTEATPYAIMVSFEMKNAVGVDLEVYSKIAEKIRPRIQIQPMAEERGEE